jgi:hypothetical protein
MNERIESLIELSEVWDTDGDVDKCEVDLYKFAELIVRECVNTLEFHGFDDAVPYIKWMATNKLGVK